MIFLMMSWATIQAEERRWTSRQGKVFHASLIHFDGKRVYLLNDIDVKIWVPVEKLCAADRLYVTEPGVKTRPLAPGEADRFLPYGPLLDDPPPPLAPIDPVPEEPPEPPTVGDSATNASVFREEAHSITDQERGAPFGHWLKPLIAAGAILLGIGLLVHSLRRKLPYVAPEEQRFYDRVKREMAEGRLDAQLWNKAQLTAQGREQVCRHLYLQLRVRQLIAAEAELTAALDIGRRNLHSKRKDRS